MSRDTTDEMERRQIEIWRRMSSVDKAALVSRASLAVRELALIGIERRYPDAAPRDRFLRMVALTLDPVLAAHAYPEIATLKPSPR